MTENSIAGQSRLNELTLKASKESLTDEEQAQLFKLIRTVIPQANQTVTGGEVRLVSYLSDDPNFDSSTAIDIEKIIDEELGK